MAQIATTIEQSERLLNAGLDPESADMWWVTIQPLKQEGWKLVPNGEPFSTLQLYKSEHIAVASYEETPAWSLSRLIDINGGGFVSISNSSDLIDFLVESIRFLTIMGDIKEEYLSK